jgi:hypothetical protein
MKLVKTTLLSSAILLSGCASVENYRVAVQSWHGATSAQLFRVWGYPNQIRHLPDRNVLYVYRYEDKGRSPVFTTPGYTSVTTKEGNTLVTHVPRTFSGGETYDYHCITWFEINRKNRVIGTSFRGNSCTATPAMMQTNSRPGSLPLPPKKLNKK